MSGDTRFKILISGLDNVGKSTIITKFKEGFQKLKEKNKSGARLRDGEDKLVDLDIQIDSHTITQSQIVDEYIPKSQIDVNQYKIIVIVFDLGEKDSLKQLASKLQGSSLNLSQINPKSKCALWGNKQDLFKFDSNADLRTAEKAYELEREFMKLGYVKSNSLNADKNEPFQNINILIQEYMRFCSSMNQSYQTSIGSPNNSENKKLSDDSDISDISHKFLKKNENNSRRLSNKTEKCSISSFKCQSEVIPTRPTTKKSKKKYEDFSATSGSKCTIF